MSADDIPFDQTPYPQPHEALEFLIPREVPSMHRPKGVQQDLILQYQIRSIALADIMDRTDAIEIYIEPARVNRSRFDAITVEEDGCGGLKVTRTKMGS